MAQAQTVSYKNRKAVEDQAAQILKQHGLYSVPVDPVVLANREGIRVVNAKFADDSLAGMVSRRGSATMVLVDQDNPPRRKRFTIAHELGHHFLHLQQDGDYIDSDRDLFRGTAKDEGEPIETHRPEIQANWFAAALLMPAALVRKAYSQTSDVEELARIFNVSEEAMGYRLDTLGLG